MKKSTLGLVAIIGLATVLTGCNSKEVWDVEFSNHVHNRELQEERTVTDAPAAKMRVLKGETAEETMARMQAACENMGGEGTDGVCTLEDGSVVAF